MQARIDCPNLFADWGKKQWMKRMNNDTAEDEWREFLCKNGQTITKSCSTEIFSWILQMGNWVSTTFPMLYFLKQEGTSSIRCLFLQNSPYFSLHIDEKFFHRNEIVLLVGDLWLELLFAIWRSNFFILIHGTNFFLIGFHKTPASLFKISTCFRNLE